MSLKRLLRDSRQPAIQWLVDWAGGIYRVCRDYWGWHGRLPRFLTPVRYTDKVQWRKLFDLNPIYAILSDKLAVRGFITERVGSDRLIPLLWSGENPDDIPFERLPRPYAIKSTHASGHVILVGPHDPVDAGQIRATAREWLSYCHGASLGEPGYVPVPRRIVIEPLIQAADGGRPVERKVFVFDGKVEFIQTATHEDGQVRGAFHTSEWHSLPWHFINPPLPVPRPRQLGLIIDLAERLGAGFDHLRVDFYDTEDDVRIGEMTLYAWSGRGAFKPDEADYILGSYWKLQRPAWRAFSAMLRGRRTIPPAAPGGAV